PEAAADDVALGFGVRRVQPSMAPTRAAAPASRRNSRRSMGFLTDVWARWDESLPGDVWAPGLGARVPLDVRLSCGRHTAAVRLTDFWGRMRQHFGATYAASFAHDFVLSELGGRTIDQALAQGVDVQEIWRAVCRTVEVAPKLR
ncbi:MAG TPA: DUF3046 domain-containing protein, partial [Acidothermaceae bacterium]